jgi:hypothetical protein
LFHIPSYTYIDTHTHIHTLTYTHRFTEHNTCPVCRFELPTEADAKQEAGSRREGSESTSESEPVPLSSVRTPVRIQGLQRRPELNGLTGHLQLAVPCTASGRYAVDIVRGNHTATYALRRGNFELLLGTPVRIQGLQRRPELNGLIGHLQRAVPCHGHAHASGRYAVDIVRGNHTATYALRPENFELLIRPA